MREYAQQLAPMGQMGMKMFQSFMEGAMKSRDMMGTPGRRDLRAPNRTCAMSDTIFALSSGAPPAAVALLRVSGPGAGLALTELSGRALPKPRRAVLRTLRGSDGEQLDQRWCCSFPLQQPLRVKNWSSCIAMAATRSSLRSDRR
jgi:hypothetical protein